MALPTLGVAVEAGLEKFEQQMGDLGDMADKAVSAIEQKFASLNPSINTSAFSGGLLGGLLGGAALDGLQRIISAIADANHQLADMDTTARRVGLTLDQFQSQRFAADVFGTSNSQFDQTLQGMAAKLNEANDKENSLTKLFEQNNLSVKNTNGQLLSMNDYLKIAADLVARAKTEQDKFDIATKLGATKDAIPFLEQGSVAIQRWADAAKDVGVVIDEQTIAKAKQFDQEWRQSSAEWTTYMKAAAAGILPAIDDLIKKAQEFVNSFSASEIGEKVGSAIKGVGNNILLGDIVSRMPDTDSAAQMRQFLQGLNADEAALLLTVNGIDERWKSILQTIVASAAAGASFEQGFGRAPADNVPIPRGRPANLGPPTNDPKKDDDDSKSAFDRQVDAIQKHITTLEADTAAIGKNRSETEAMKAEMSLLQAVQRDADDDDKEEMQKKIDNFAKLRATMDAQTALQKAGIELDKDQADAFAKVSQRAGEAAAALQKTQMAWQGYNSAIQFGGNQIIDVIDGIRTKSETAGQAVNNMLNALIKALEQAALLGSGPLAGLLGTASTASGGTGGALGLLTGLFKGGFAEGGTLPPGTWGIAGERGPEPIYAGTTGMTVVPTPVSSRSGGSSTSIAVTIGLEGANGDATIREIAGKAAAIGVQTGLAQYDGALPSRLAEISMRGL